MKRTFFIFGLLLLILIMTVGCSTETSTSVADNASTEAENNSTSTGIYNDVDLASQYNILVEKVKNNIIDGTYHNDKYNLDISYGIYIPEEYNENEKYPLVMFIPDSSLVGKDLDAILDQGYGGVVWADDEVQTGNPALILYPIYSTTIIDDNKGRTISDYVPATVGLIDGVKEKYSVDENRIYATGQSMGAMTSMVLAADNPDLFAACMFVDGQWEASALAPLANQTFCYFAAQDDIKAYEGMQEAIPVWKENGANIIEATWDANWSHEEVQEEAQKLLENDSKTYCIVWETGTIGSGSGSGKGRGGASVHMASFNYAYNVNTMVGWILGQTK